MNNSIAARFEFTHEVEFNAALIECIPATMPRRGLEMAIDFRDEPF